MFEHFLINPRKHRYCLAGRRLFRQLSTEDVDNQVSRRLFFEQMCACYRLLLVSEMDIIGSRHVVNG